MGSSYVKFIYGSSSGGDESGRIIEGVTSVTGTADVNQIMFKDLNGKANIDPYFYCDSLVKRISDPASGAVVFEIDTPNGLYTLGNSADIARPSITLNNVDQTIQFVNSSLEMLNISREIVYLQQGQSVKYKEIGSDNSYVVEKNDYYIGMSPDSTLVDLDLDGAYTPENGQQIVVADCIGNAATFSVRISSSYGIKGASSYLIAENWGCVTLTFTGSQWLVS